MISLTTALLILILLLALLPSEAYAFGAGEIPDFAYLNDKAFRHGDIENVLSELAKTAAGAAAGGGSLFGFAHALISAASGGSKFGNEDVKKVYFGNWLRDYSQAMDIAGLSKLSGDTIALIVAVLGFVTFGFATEEYQVTSERLGVYLPVEHIDNPKGYAEKEGDARRFDPRLRPPVRREELEIDPRTGMKNYIATENRGWDTSTAHIRRTFRACIDRGRRAQGREGADLWEAYRLLGTGLHTMEDLLAHSNWCELALRKMGHRQVFCHVGDSVVINTPGGQAPPLVTGTFGSADFLHSLMGEASDHLSEASVVDLSQHLNTASQNDNGSSLLRTILKKLPIGGSSNEDKVSQADDMKAEAKAYQFNPDNMMPPQVQQRMMQLLKWRDDIYRDILKQIQMIPGLESLITSFTDALNAFVYTILAPYLTPLLQEVTSVLTDGSKAILDSDHAEQYAVFDNPHASDPSHSLLSKDHFALILNEPAGKIAMVVVRYVVKLIVDAWFDQNQNPDHVIDQILEAFHHPYYNRGRSRIQQDMFEEMEKWFQGLGPAEGERVIRALTKESVRAGNNKRQDADGDKTSSGQTYGQAPAHSSKTRPDESYAEAVEAGPGQQSYDGYQKQTQQGYQQHGRQSNTQGGYGGTNQNAAYQTSYATGGYGGSQETPGSEYHYQSRTQSGYELTYARPDPTESYGRRRDEDEGGYGRSTSGPPTNSYGGSQPAHAHAQHQHMPRRQYQEEVSVGSAYVPSYAAASETPSEGRYGGRAGYGGGDEYEGRTQSRQQHSGNDYSGSAQYGGSTEYGQPEGRSGRYGGESGYGQSVERPSHGRSEGGYGGQNEERSSYGRTDESYGGYGRGNDESSNEYGRGHQSSGNRRDDFSRDTHSSAGQESAAYGGQRYGSSGGSYGQQQSHGHARRNDDDDDERHKSHHTQRQQAQESGGYGRGGGGGYGGGGSDETFGAERLNINDSSGDEHSHKKHHKKHHSHSRDDSD